MHCFLDAVLVYSYSISITFVCTGKPKNFTLLKWSGIKSSLSLRYVCIFSWYTHQLQRWKKWWLYGEETGSITFIIWSSLMSAVEEQVHVIDIWTCTLWPSFLWSHAHFTCPESCREASAEGHSTQWHVCNL